MNKLDEFSSYLKGQRKHTKACFNSHILRAQKILGYSEKYDYPDADNYVEQISEERNYSNSTKNKYYQTFNWLNKCFEWSWEKEFKKIPELSKPREMLSIKELYEFFKLDTVPKYNLLIRLAISTGARPSEILTLQRKEIDLSRRLITLDPGKVKTRRSRLLVIKWFLVGDLEQFIADNKIGREHYLFYYRDKNKPLTIASLEDECDRRLGLLNVDKKVTPYSMRHSYCTRMAARINSMVLKELAGHSNIQTTEGYFHFNEFLLRDAADKDILFEEHPEFLTHYQQIMKVKTWIDELCKVPEADQIKLSQAQTLIFQSFPNLRQMQNKIAY